MSTNSDTAINISADILRHFRTIWGLSSDNEVTERLNEVLRQYIKPSKLDALTGCHKDLKRDILWMLELGTDGDRFRESFLCCDIDNFGWFCKQHGHAECDQKLIQVADCLKKFGKPVYRFDGDGFVVRDCDTPIDGLDSIVGVSVRQCVVQCDVLVDRARLHRLVTWIDWHLQAALLQFRSVGATIRCGDPRGIIQMTLA